MPQEEKYGSTWVKKDLIPLKGQWAIVVGIIEDKGTKERKLRVAKGRIKGSIQVNLGKVSVHLDDPADPITQVNRLNIKTKAEWLRIKELVDKYAADMNDE